MPWHLWSVQSPKMALLSELIRDTDRKSVFLWDLILIVSDEVGAVTG